MRLPKQITPPQFILAHKHKDDDDMTRLNFGAAAQGVGKVLGIGGRAKTIHEEEQNR